DPAVLEVHDLRSGSVDRLLIVAGFGLGARRFGVVVQCRLGLGRRINRCVGGNGGNRRVRSLLDGTGLTAATCGTGAEHAKNQKSDLRHGMPLLSSASRKLDDKTTRPAADWTCSLWINCKGGRDDAKVQSSAGNLACTNLRSAVPFSPLS